MRRLVPVSFALALTLTFGTVDAWAKGNALEPKVVEPAENVAATRAQIQDALPFPLAAEVNDDLVEYAQREAKTMGLEEFHGGDVVIIGGSGLVLLLLIILLIVLL